MAKASPLEAGRMVWAKVVDANGIRKLRPAVIVSAIDQSRPGQPLELVAVTSLVPDPLPPDHVLLPWHPQGHPRTGLNRQSAAVCAWLFRIMPADIISVAGIVSGPVLFDPDENSVAANVRT